MPKHTRGRSAVLLALSLVVAVLAPVAASEVAQAAPIDSPVLTSPSNGTAHAGNPSLTWDPITAGDGSGDPVQKYRVQISTNNAFSSTIVNTDTYNTTFTPPDQLPMGTIYWRVAGNQSGIGPFSSTGTFDVDLEAPANPQPPNGTELDFPTQGSAFTWDPLPGAKSYEFDYADNLAFVSPGGVDTKTNGVILVGTTPFDETYYWRVRGNYGSGIQSEWTAPQTFSITWPDEVGKGKPQVLTPTPTNSPTPPTKVSDIELSWDPVLGAKDYRVQVSLSIDFSGSLVLNNTFPGTRYSPRDTWDNGSYFWRVRARDYNGHEGPWSDIEVFERAWPIDPGAPNGPEGIPGVLNPPALVAPLDGGVATNQIRFEWEPTDRASYYEVQTGDDPSFSPGTFKSCDTIHTSLGEYNTRSPGGAVDSPPGSCTNSIFTGGADRYWRVRGIDAPSNVLGQWSEIWNYSFTREVLTGNDCGAGPGNCTAPAITYLSPTDCGPGGGCDENTFIPDLTWAAVPDAKEYHVWVALDPAFTTVVGTYEVAPSANGGTLATPRLRVREEWPDNDAGQAYYWHIRTCFKDDYLTVDGNNADDCTGDPQGNPTIAKRAFQKRSEPIELTAPANDPVGGAENYLREMPRFEWEDYLASNSSDIEVKQYRIQVSTTEVFNNTIDNRVVDQTFYSSLGDTYPEGPLYWRVRAIDASNNELSWSEVRRFVYQSEPPTLVAPADDSVNQGVPRFTWTLIDYATRYDFELYKNGDDPLSSGNRIDNRTTMYGTFQPYLDLPVGRYAWRVRRNDGSNRDGPWSEVSRFTVTGQAPLLNDPPTDFHFDSNDITFSWAPVNGASKYRFERSRTEDFSSVDKSIVTVMTTWAPTSQLQDAQHWWRVTALGPDNDPIGTSDARPFTKDTRELPAAPQSIGVFERFGGLTVSWTPPPAAQQGDPAYNQYEISIAGGETKTVSKTTLSTTFNGLTNGEIYNVSVKAVSSAGAGDAATDSGAPNGCQMTPFGDVSDTSIFCADIAWLFGEDITSGSVLPDGTVNYGPTAVVSRQAMAKFLFAYMGDEGFVPPPTATFNDVPTSSIFYTAVEWLAQSGITGGCGGGSFCPTAAVSRQSMAQFLFKASGEGFVAPASPSFTDVPRSSIFFKAVEWLVAQGVTSGCSGSQYCPTSPVSRQQMAKFLHNYDLNVAPSGVDPSSSGV